MIESNHAGHLVLAQGKPKTSPHHSQSWHLAPPPRALALLVDSKQQLQPLKRCSFPPFVRAAIEVEDEGEWEWV